MSGQRVAVLVGIDEYPNLGPAQQLSGCVNDVELMAGVLQSAFGFAESDITLLRNTEASRDAILAAFNGLVDGVDADDVVVVHYSGHGSQMTDREGDEPDGLDETIVPSDSGRGNAPNRDISDDEIYDWLTRLNAKTQLVTLIFDCCHSGSVTRDAFGAAVRWIEPDLRPAAELPKSPVAAPATRSAGPSGWLPPGRRYTLMAGCRDEELSHEYGTPTGATHGALTWFLTQALAGAAKGATYRDVFEPAALGVSTAFPSQHPQMEGAAEREVFGVREREPQAFVAVTARAGAEVTLGGGAAQGVQVGSVWGVFDGEKRLGTLRVTAVRATTATAEVVDEPAADAIAAPARAVLEDEGLDEPRLRVAVPDELADLADRIGQSSLLERTDGDAKALVLSPRGAAATDDPVPQLKSIDTATVAVVGADGRLLVPTRPGDAADTPARVVADLEIVARYRRVLARENPASGLRIDLALLRQGAGGVWVEATPETAGGDVVFEEGERIGVRITNASDRSLYPAVVDMGLAYAIGLVAGFGGNQELKPGVSVEIGTRPGEEIPLGFPAAFPFGGDADTTDGGIEVVKVFAATAPGDYTSLQQAGVTRDMVQTAHRDDADWTTATRAFRLRMATAGVAVAPQAAAEAGGVEVALQGATASAAPVGSGGGRTEAAGLSTRALEDVMSDQSLDVQTAIVLDDMTPGTRAIDAPPPAIVMRPPPPAPGEGQMVLRQDEDGIMTWHFAAASRSLDDQRREYRIDRRVVVDSQEVPAGTRGFLTGAIAKKLLKVLVFPLVEPAIGEVADYFAGKWEAKKRPYRLRFSTPQDFATPGGADVGADDWAKLSGQRSLLLVHGTFSRSHSGFGELPAGTFEDLYKRYGQRVIALEHPTLSETPEKNIQWMLDRVPDGTDLELDIVCHSRGGLVARTLAERQSEFSLGNRTLRIRRVIFVATPNSGTALADGSHVGDLLDTYTNLLNFVPDPSGVTDILDGIVTVAKMLAVGAMKGLDGLQAMVPGGKFQTWLNTGPAPQGTTYCALAADYEPSSPALRSFVSDAVMDAIFAKLGNDLVVPTDGVFAKNGAGLFPIDSRHVFAKDEDVVHTRFFAHKTTQEKLLTWLGEQ